MNLNNIFPSNPLFIFVFGIILGSLITFDSKWYGLGISVATLLIALIYKYTYQNK